MADTKLVLSARSSLFLFRRFHLEHVKIVWLTDDFWHHQLAPSMGKYENSNSHITTSQTKSCMVLTHSMATNNHTEEEPRTIALERQVQTLVAAVECLTKQNHNLEEQLRQRDAGPNNHREDQEGTKVKRKDQEGPEGSNTSSRLKRQDTNCPSVTETAPPHIVAEM